MEESESFRRNEFLHVVKLSFDILEQDEIIDQEEQKYRSRTRRSLCEEMHRGSNEKVHLFWLQVAVIRRSSHQSQDKNGTHH